MVTSVEILAALGVEGVAETKRGIESVADAVEKLRKEQKGSEEQSRKYDQSLREVGQGALVAGGGLLAGFGGAVFASANFDQAMSGVAAVSGATSAELDLLRQSALDAGQATVFSASEAATAQGELAKAGVATSDILGGALTGSLNLAAAGQLDLATSATITGQALNIFNLEGSQSSHVADLLAAGANKSAADVMQLGDALAQGGLVAKGANLSIEETVGTLALFADNALVGSDAGTSLKAMLLALQGPSDKSAKLMDELGLNVYDASGQFIGMEGLAGQLQDRLGGLTDAEQDYALAQIFGNDAVRAARALMSEGADGVRDYTAAVNDQGAAQRMASVQMDNLAGDLEQLKGSIETALIEGGSEATGVLRGLTQSATGLVNEFSQAPGWLQGTAVGIAGVGGVSLTTVGAIGMMIPKLREVKTAFQTLPAGATAGMIGLTAAVTVGTLALASWAREKEQARQRTLGFIDAIRADSGAIGENSRAYIENELQRNGQLDDLGRLRGHLTSGRAALDVYTDAVGGSAEAQREFRQALVDSGEIEFDIEEDAEKFVEFGASAFGAKKGIEFFAEGNTDLARTLRDMTNSNEEARASLEGVADAERTSADVTRELTAAQSELRDLEIAGKRGTDEYADAKKRVADLSAEQERAEGAVQSAIGTTTDAVEDATDAVDAYKEALDRLIGLPLSLEKAAVGWVESIAELNETLFTNGMTLDANTAAGRENRGAIMDSVDATKAQAEAVLEQARASGEEAAGIAFSNEIIRQHREQLEATLIQYGLTKEEANAYLDQLGLIPETVRTQVEMDVTANVETNFHTEGLTRRAAGGPLRAGQAAIVGEHRPELFVPSTDGYVFPEVPTSIAASSGAGGGTVAIAVNIDLRGAVGVDHEKISPVIVDALAAYVRENGAPSFLRAG